MIALTKVGTPKAILASLACALILGGLEGCGSGGSGAGPQGNAAENATFTYGAAVAASPAQVEVLTAPVSGVSSFAGAPDATSGLAFTDFSAVTAALLSDSGVGLASASLESAGSQAAQAMVARNMVVQAAVVGTGFDNPACVTATATSVTLTGCTITQDQTSDGTTMHMVVRADGSVSHAVATNALTWNLGITSTLSMSGGITLSASASLHLSGTLTVTASQIVGAMKSEARTVASSGGQTVSAGVHESLSVNVTYADTCASLVTGGTLEAKRVWTERPAGATAIDLPNHAAKITWTGCGAGTIQLSS